MAALRRLFSFLLLAVLAVVGFWALNLDRGGWAATAITCAFFGTLLLVAQIPRLRQDDVLLNALLQACVGVLLLGGAALIAVLRLHSLSWLVALGAFLLGPVIVGLLQFLWRIIGPSTDRHRPDDDQSNEPIAFYDPRIDAENDVLWRTGRAFRR